MSSDILDRRRAQFLAVVGLLVSFVWMSVVVCSYLDSLELLLSDLTSALVQVDLRLLADEVGEATADTANLAQGIHHLAGAVHVGVQHTQQALEVSILNDQRLKPGIDR